MFCGRCRDGFAPSLYIFRGKCVNCSHCLQNPASSELPQSPYNLSYDECELNNREGMFCGRCRDGFAPSLYIFRGKCVNCSHCLQNPASSELPQSPYNLSYDECELNNREGMFCGRCRDGFAPSLCISRGKCVNCSHCLQNPASFFLFLASEVFPLTVFYLILMKLRLNIVSGPMLGYVMFCQTHINSVILIQSVMYFQIFGILYFLTRQIHYIFGTLMYCFHWQAFGI